MTGVDVAARCGLAVIDADGQAAPCDRPATGWRWYQDCAYHEDLLDVACELHANEGGRRIAEAERQRDDALAKIARALSDHWQTRGMWGGVLRDLCGRCRHGDGVPFLWPCLTRQILTGEAAPDPRPPNVEAATAAVDDWRVAGTGGPQNPAQGRGGGE